MVVAGTGLWPCPLPPSDLANESTMASVVYSVVSLNYDANVTHQAHVVASGFRRPCSAHALCCSQRPWLILGPMHPISLTGWVTRAARARTNIRPVDAE